MHIAALLYPIFSIESPAVNIIALYLCVVRSAGHACECVCVCVCTNIGVIFFTEVDNK